MPLLRKISGLLALLAGAGFVLVIAVHLPAWFGIVWLPERLFMGVIFLLFPLWTVTVLVSNRLAKNAPPKDMWRAVWRFAPRWMRWLTNASFVWAGINFVLFIVMQIGGGEQTEMDSPLGMRGISGHLLVFYAAALTTLTSFARSTDERTSCPDGHPVSPFANFCATCGQAIERG